MEENKNLLLKGAMTYGLAMGIYWVVKYIFFIFSVSVPSLSLVYWLLTLAVPFIAYYMTKRYRHDIGTKSLGNNKAPACESRGFVHKKRRCAF